MRLDARVLTAEFIGTFSICFIAVGAICTDSWTRGSLGLVGVAFAYGSVVAVMVSALGGISGGHFNPAVTLSVFAAGKLDATKTASYVIAQLLGATAAGVILAQIFPITVWQPINLGTPMPADGVSIGSAVLIETILTFFWVLTVFCTVVNDQRSLTASPGLIIGAVVVFGTLLAGPLTGASMNPARVLGPAVASGAWNYHLIYWIGPILGGLLASYVSMSVLRKSSR